MFELINSFRLINFSTLFCLIFLFNLNLKGLPNEYDVNYTPDLCPQSQVFNDQVYETEFMLHPNFVSYYRDMLSMANSKMNVCIGCVEGTDNATYSPDLEGRTKYYTSKTYDPHEDLEIVKAKDAFAKSHLAKISVETQPKSPITGTFDHDRIFILYETLSASSALYENFIEEYKKCVKRRNVLYASWAVYKTKRREFEEIYSLDSQE